MPLSTKAVIVVLGVPYADFHTKVLCGECHYAECRYANVIILSTINFNGIFCILQLFKSFCQKLAIHIIAIEA